ARIALAGSPTAGAAAAGAAGPAAGRGGTGDALGADGADGAAELRPLTFRYTANRRFEASYWRRIAFLAEGRFVNKDNADVVRDPVTLGRLSHRQRDLDALADYLLDYYRRLLAARGMDGEAAAGDLPFRWQTDFDFSWSGGWLGNQQGHLEERNVMVAIPGRDRSRAVIMADHYDTAYMEDRYGYQHGGHGPRLAAAGADDNHSATVALMLAAPIFLEMSRAGRLGCDVWLVHLTGEEFPADCLGARHLAQWLVEGRLRLRTRQAAAASAAGDAAAAGFGRDGLGRDGIAADGIAGGGDGWLDLSETRVQGVYVLDMVAHNNDRERDVFQICPGAGGESLWLALQAHLANRAWNRLAPRWNRRSRGRCKRGRRSPDGKTMPALALHPQLRGEVRPPIDPRSTLYNTDGQIFSDAGVPVVLFMEDYDINRHGYHDSHDTMENIDLDYGAAVAAIAIETVARAVTEPPPDLPRT
ncbi:MAG: M28 family peptidase, partial [Acidobacteria bacterium]|nr:M28 family peptidase [Acidobacteriota bacterium]